MAAVLSLVLSGILLPSLAQAQAYDSGQRDEDAFSYLQPLNTTILGGYGHSPEVLPSREFLLPSISVKYYRLIRS